MDNKRIITGLIALALLVPQILGCMVGEPCEQTALSVYLSADSEPVGTAPMTVTLSAEGYGVDNNCFDTNDTVIVEYRWDLDGNGIYEVREADTEITVTFEEPGTYLVAVAVIDDDGGIAEDMMSFEVGAAEGR